MESSILARTARIAKLSVITENKFYAVPTLFLNQLKKHLDNPLAVQKPTIIDTTPLICIHNQFKYDPEVDNRNNNLFWVVLDSDWMHLKNNYDTKGPEIAVTPQQGLFICMYPDLGWCEPCRIETLSNYTSGSILVVQRDPNENPKLLQEIKKRSTRKTSIKQASRLEVDITPQMTLRELMLLLVPKFKAHPLYQKLYKNHTELEEMDATLKELRIFPGDRLEIEVFNQGLQDFEDDEPIVEVEAGFKGTMLQD